jgi:hypothetical protein
MGRFDPFAKPSGNGRYLREAATRRLGFDPRAAGALEGIRRPSACLDRVAVRATWEL